MNPIYETLEERVESWTKMVQEAKEELIYTIKENRPEDKIFFWVKHLSTCLNCLEESKELLKKQNTKK